MADSTSQPEDRDLVTFVVPRAHARSVAKHLASLGLTVGRAPSHLAVMAKYDTHLAIPDPSMAEHLTRIAGRFAILPSGGSPFDTTMIVEREA